MTVGGGERCRARPLAQLGCGQCCDEATQPCLSWHTARHKEQLVCYGILYRRDAVQAQPGPCIPPEASVHMGARNIPNLLQLQAGSSLEGTFRGEVSGFGLGAASSLQVPSWVVLRSLPRPPSLSLLAHLHDVLNYGGPSGELVGLLADPLLPLRLAPAAQGGLGRKSTGTP